MGLQPLVLIDASTFIPVFFFFFLRGCYFSLWRGCLLCAVWVMLLLHALKSSAADTRCPYSALHVVSGSAHHLNATLPSRYCASPLLGIFAIRSPH